MVLPQQQSQSPKNNLHKQLVPSPTQLKKQQIKSLQTKNDLVHSLTRKPQFIISLIVFIAIFLGGIYWGASKLLFPAQQTTPDSSRFFRTTSPLIDPLIPLTTSKVQKINLDQIAPELQPQQHTFRPLSTSTPEDTQKLHQINKANGSYFISTSGTIPLTRPVQDPKEGLETKRVNLTPLLIRAYPHDSSCFTQGYAFYEGELFESCGLYRESRLRTVDYTTGAILRKTPVTIPATFFAEGIVIGKSMINGIQSDVLLLLTWKEQAVLRYNPTTLERIEPDLPLQTEGWGITIDPLNNQLVVSDGSNTLFWYNIDTMALVRKVVIQEWSKSLKKFTQIQSINELEWVGNEIWANVWYSHDIICIDPNTGQVLRRLDGSTLRSSRRSSEDVFNGIAFGTDSKGETKLLVTGKKWAQTFELDYTQVVIPYNPANDNGASGSDGDQTNPDGTDATNDDAENEVPNGALYF